MQSKKSLTPFFFGALILILLWVMWFTPSVHAKLEAIDGYIFLQLNKMAAKENFTSYFWMLMNHPEEKWINVVFMASVHMLAILLFKGRGGELAKAFLIYWILIQIFIVFNHSFYHQLLEIKRFSPYYVFGNINVLSDIYQNPSIKDRSVSSFPGGHAFAAFFWLFYTSSKLKSYKWDLLLFVIAFPIIIARVVSGAHWPSDVFYAGVQAYCFFALTRRFL
jgi:membrane-associated phospholipid phosphatase